MTVAMKHPATGEIKQIKVGWSWTLFFFSGVLGLPLFWRRLYVWGSVELVIWAVNLINESLEVRGPLILVSIGLSIFLGIKGNEMTAKNYLEHAWTFLEPDSDMTRMAKMRWGITI